MTFSLFDAEIRETGRKGIKNVKIQCKIVEDLKKKKKGRILKGSLSYFPWVTFPLGKKQEN